MPKQDQSRTTPRRVVLSRVMLTIGLCVTFAPALARPISTVTQPTSPPTKPTASPPAPAPPTSSPTSAPPSAPQSPSADPTLDELLGLAKPEARKETEDGEATPAIPIDPASKAINDRLSKTEEPNEFEAAVELMNESSRLLNDSKDVGIATQRVQEQTLAKLDKLLDQARKQQSKKKSKSKSQQNEDQQEKNQKQQQSSQQQAQQKPTPAQGAAGNPSVPGGAAKMNPPPGAGAAWGNLPQRLRDALTQGSSDYTSAKWESLTREYYKRLAEQPGTSATDSTGGLNR